MIVSEVIERLRQFPDSAMVMGTWEGQIMDISIYAGKDGQVLIDCDGEDFRWCLEDSYSGTPNA